MLIKSVINWSLKKPTPESGVAIVGDDASNNDYIVLGLEMQEFNWQFRPSKKEKRGYSGRLFENKTGGRPATLLNSQIRKLKPEIDVTHYYKGHIFTYKSPWRFLLSCIFKRYFIYDIAYKLRQKSFNRRPLVMADRVELLRTLVNLRIQRPEEEFSFLDLAENFHTIRWIMHPDSDLVETHIEMLLQSLVLTGDAEKIGYQYRATPQAFTTLFSFEREEQQHKDNLSTSRSANRLTVVIAIIGFIGITISLIDLIF